VPDAARLSAAAIAVLVGVLTRSGLWAVICGAAALYLTPVLLGVLG
jgi:branched-subunit amino acid transport protein